MKNARMPMLAAALAGGIAGAAVIALVLPRHAALPAAGAAQAAVVSAQQFRLVDADGKVHATLSLAGDGEPALFFFDRQGHNRMVLGVYPQSEGGQPFIVLNDLEQHAAGIFRLFGPHETPVVVLKSNGQDRSIYGLNPGSLDPFLVNIAPDGKKSNVFGAW